MSTPRVFIARHGETEWSLSGKHTGVTDIALTADGEKRVRATGRALVGNDRLIVPDKLTHIFVSPRRRAQRTFELLNLGFKDLPWDPHGPVDDSPGLACNARIDITDDIREWDYGDYEGVTSNEIRRRRKEQGLGDNSSWDIWTDGCPGGESPHDVTQRLDRLIARVRSYQEPFMRRGGQPNGLESSSSHGTGDVLIVGHGHILRAFAMRWVGKTLQDGPTFLMEAGGVGTLSYEHNNIHEPAILLGGAFVVNNTAEVIAEAPKN
ncbi:phosphoglycerate mutase [Diaporthe helianthi]|uniref:Phosphoglycerate mutase n=1 Tax=Diaporthe helianthi TaxID=158607 RepID=A0A2P5IFW1_DIAHE|nr:phosphoglycerate mutase [Diaporthe helianthi]